MAALRRSTVAVLALVAVLSACSSIPANAQTPKEQAPSPFVEAPLETAFKDVLRSIGQQAIGEKAVDLFRAGKYVDALVVGQKALELTVKALGPDHPDVATVLIGLGVLFGEIGAYENATTWLTRALEIKERALGPDDPQVALALSYLAELYRHMGAYAKAKPLLIRAIQISEQTIGSEHLQVGLDLGQLAMLYENLGDYSEAVRLSKQSLAILEKALGQQHPYVAGQINNLAWVYLDMGDYAKAKSGFEQAIEIQEKSVGPDHPYLVYPLRGIALMYSYIRDYERAIPLYQRMLTIQIKAFGPEHPEVATTLNEMAILFDGAGGFAQGVPFNQRALAIREKSLGPDHPYVALSLNNLAVEYAALGEYAKAEPLYQRALVIRVKALGLEHPDVANTLNNLAFVYQRRGDYTKAESFYRRALEINEKSLGPMHLKVMQTIELLASLSATQQNYRSAIGFYKRIHLIQEQQIRNIFTFTTEEQKLRYIQTISGDYYAVLSLINQHLRNDQETVRYALELVLRRKGIVFDAQSRVRETLQGQLSETARTDWNLLTTLQSQLARLTLNKPEQMSLELYKETMTTLHKQIERVEQRLANESALVAKELQQRTVSVESAAKALPEHSALVEFVKIEDFDFTKQEWIGSGRYLAFVLTAVGDVALVDLGDASALEEKARKVLQDIRVSMETRGLNVLKKSGDFDANKQSLKSLSELYFQLWAPLEKTFGNADKVLVSPDSLLNLVPFVALMNGDGQPLIERYQIAYVSSGRELIGSAGATIQPDSDLLLVANPAFGTKVKGSGSAVASVRSRDFRGVFDPLPGTEREAKEIPPLVSDRGGKRSVLVESSATEGSVKSAHSPRILHLATHGFFLRDEEIDLCGEMRGVTVMKKENNEGSALCAKARGVTVVKKEKPEPRKQYENPLVRSGLAFAGANRAFENTEGDDGILTALEITSMDLYGTELVVLSACDTGVGEVKTGEGVFGLRRAFALSGAKNLMMSLWPVSDEITANQMKAFYQNLQKLPPAEALRQAQLETIKELKAKDGVISPALWAPFILQGAQALGQ